MELIDARAVIVLTTASGVSVTVVAVLVMAIVMQRRIHSAEARYREREMALAARVSALEAQISRVLDWARTQPRAPIQEVGDLAEARAEMAMRTLFTREELDILAHEIGASLDTIGGETLAGIANRLLRYARDRGITDRLIAAVRRARPNAGV